MTAYQTLPNLNPTVCKFVVWIVELSKHHTTNPMTRKTAEAMIKERRKESKYARLIKAFSCVSAENLERS